jgi:hypothetical protein
MKIRTGFVSNSSSSSFIVATKADKKDFKITVELTLDHLVDKVIKTEARWQEHCVECGCFETLQELLDDSYSGPKYLKGLNEIKAGKTLLVGSCSNESYDDETGAEMYLFNNGLKGLNPKKFKVIEDPQY